MPVARIITVSPAESEELRRQLTAAGYSVKFTSPDEEFDDADLVVAAANVHSDYALQYASEVAAEAGADVIVAPGVVPGSSSVRNVPEVHVEAVKPRAEPTVILDQAPPEPAVPVAGVLFSTANELKSAVAESRDAVRETLGGYSSRLRSALEDLRAKRDLAAEQKRLERERREAEREEHRREALKQRAAIEAQMAVERERLRLQRQAEQEKLRREQEEMRRAMEAERVRLAAAEAEQARALREQAARDAALASMAQQAEVPPPPTVVPAAPVPQRSAQPYLRPPAARVHQHAPRRRVSRDKRFQRAAFYASVAALVAMIGFAVALNVHPSSPMPHSMVQNPVQEQSPFGAASITPKPAAAKPATATPATRATLPQRDAAPVPTKPTPARPARRTRRAHDNYVAEDEVVIHHYGTPKHPPAAQTRAGVPRYTDEN